MARWIISLVTSTEKDIMEGIAPESDFAEKANQLPSRVGEQNGGAFDISRLPAVWAES